MSQICEVTGLVRTNFYRHPDGIEGVLKEATGLKVLGANVIVLCKSDDIAPEYDNSFVEQALEERRVEKLAEEAEMLSPESIAKLITRLSVTE